MVMAGQYDVVVAGGVESMTRVPLGSGRDLGRPYGPLVRERYAEDLESGEFPGGDFNQGVGAERIARDWGFSRTRLDEYASRSHELAAAAIDAGAFDGQLAPIPGAPGFTADEGLRRGTTPETLAKLKPSFREDGLIHAGNSSQISDGASAVLVTTPERAKELGLTPIVRYHSGAVSGANPLPMLTGPIPATQKVLKRSGLAIGEIGAFEVNEAFAPVPLAWQAELGADDDRLNPLGGAIAVGHPLGASGTVLMTRLVHHMRDHDIRYGLQTMCEGGGTANATIVELVA
jgi:acetyl-CoA acyltransferase